MTETIPVRLVIGADGAYSATRTSLMRLSRIDYSQRYVLGAAGTKGGGGRSYGLCDLC